MSINKRILAVFLVMGLLLAVLPAIPAHASTIWIDYFDSSQTVTVTTGGTNPKSSFGSLNDTSGYVIGDYRSIYVERTVGSAEVSVTSGFNSGQHLAHSQQSQQEGYSQIWWDGNSDQDIDVASGSGLGGVDLTGSGTNTAFRIYLVENDKAFDMILQVWSDSDSCSDYTLSVPALQDNVIYAIPFSGFTAACSSSADMTSVTAIRMEIDGRGVSSLDVTLDWMVAGDVPTAVDLASFTAAPAGRSIQLQWETATELDNLGFNLYRAEAAGGPWTKLNASLIPAQAPGSPVGAVYTFEDANITRGATYYYRLEDLDVYGQSQFHGPVSATLLLIQRTLIRPRLDAGLTRK